MDPNISHKITDGMGRRGERQQPAQVDKSQEATATDNKRGVMMGGSGATQGDNKGVGGSRQGKINNATIIIDNEGREGRNNAAWVRTTTTMVTVVLLLLEILIFVIVVVDDDTEGMGR